MARRCRANIENFNTSQIAILAAPPNIRQNVKLRGVKQTDKIQIPSRKKGKRMN